MEFSESVLQEFSISKSLVTENGELNLYVDGEFKVVTTDDELREKLAGNRVRRANAENLENNYDPND